MYMVRAVKWYIKIMEKSIMMFTFRNNAVKKLTKIIINLTLVLVNFILP